MERGKITWKDEIIITRDVVTKLPKVTVEGLWTGKDRRIIGRALHREMRRQAYKIIQMHREADLIDQKKEDEKLLLTQKRIDSLAKARLAKKEKKLKEEEK